MKGSPPRLCNENGVRPSPTTPITRCGCRILLLIFRARVMGRFLLHSPREMCIMTVLEKSDRQHAFEEKIERLLQINTSKSLLKGSRRLRNAIVRKTQRALKTRESSPLPAATISGQDGGYTEAKKRSPRASIAIRRPAAARLRWRLLATRRSNAPATGEKVHPSGSFMTQRSCIYAPSSHAKHSLTSLDCRNIRPRLTGGASWVGRDRRTFCRKRWYP